MKDLWRELLVVVTLFSLILYTGCTRSDNLVSSALDAKHLVSQNVLSPQEKSSLSKILIFTPNRRALINQKIFSWMNESQLVFTAIYEKNGVVLHRNYHPDKVSKEALMSLKNHFDVTRSSRQEFNEFYLDYHIESSFIEIGNGDSKKIFLLQVAKDKPKTEPSSHSSWTYVLRQGLEKLLETASIFIAWGFVFIGIAFIFMGILKNFVSREKIDSQKRLREFAQEEWSLVEFPTLSDLKENSGSKPEGWMRFFRSQRQGMSQSQNYFDSMPYRFDEIFTYPQQKLSLDKLSKAFLQAIEGIISHSQITLFFNRKYHGYVPVLQKKGPLYIGGDAIDRTLSKKILSSLENYCYVSQKGGQELYFPIPSHVGMSGVLVCKLASPILDKSVLSKIWFEVRKFGERLHKIKKYEQATLDPVSGLGNAMSFHKALLSSFHQKKELTSKWQLCLIQFKRPDLTKHMAWIGLAIQKSFSGQVYKIAEDVFALLGAQIEENEFADMVSSFINSLQTRRLDDVSMGVALLENEVSDTNEWFKNASAALLESNEMGNNYYKYYKSNIDTYQFIPGHFT